ncbi:MAG: porin family protein [Ignavibacteriaceae bacterium]|jgi:hypothetical protein|nr:porin family protein [Ignavibacteriaceae bacterium]
MKKLNVIIVLVALLSSVEFAQFQKGQWELGFTGSLGTVNQSTKSTGTYSSNTNSSDEGFFDVSLMPGYYLIDGFSIEPELGMFAVKGESPAYNMIVNLSYTLLFPYSQNAIFLKAGYGFGNATTYPTADEVLLKMTDKFDVDIINFGVGVKFSVTEKAFIRVEANYRIQSWNDEYTSFYYSYTQKYEQSFKTLRLKIGLGVLI